MAKLVLSKGGSVLYQCFIEKDRIGVGRDTHNHVVVDDPAVGAEHATIVPVGNDHVLEDLKSPGGTVVNGSRVDRHILQHGDVIELGSFFLRYLNPRLSSTIDLERTMLIAGLKGAANDAARDSSSERCRSRRAGSPGESSLPEGRDQGPEGQGTREA